MSDRARHIEWMFLDACVEHRKQCVRERAFVDSRWFQLAELIEELYPAEIAEYRKRIGVENKT